MKTAKERIIFDNDYSADLYNEIAENLFWEEKDAYEWKCVNDVPERMVWEAYDAAKDGDWEDTQAELEKFFKGGKWLLTGTIGRWDGPAQGGFIFSAFEELYKAWINCDTLKISDVNGHLYIKCSHHDGTNYFEIKQLTAAGERYADIHSYDSPREVHEALWNSTARSRLPHYAHRVFGCPKRQYEA